LFPINIELLVLTRHKLSLTSFVSAHRFRLGFLDNFDSGYV